MCDFRAKEIVTMKVKLKPALIVSSNAVGEEVSSGVQVYEGRSPYQEPLVLRWFKMQQKKRK